MKKIFGLAFSFLLILTLAACFGPSGNGGNETPDDPTVKPGPDKPNPDNPNPDNPNPDNPNPDNPHECVFGNWEVVMESSCYKKGQEQRICKECGEIETRELDFAHEYTKVEALAPTCSTTGHTEYQVCLDCNDMIGYEEIPMVAHANTHWEKINDSYHSEYCDDCGNTTDKTNLNHNFDEGVKTEATCTENGKTVYTCRDCGFSKEETIYAQGHTPGDEATCTTDQICTVCQVVLTEKTGHFEVGGGCDEDVYCSICETVLEEAAGHTSSGEATCTEHEYCTICNEKMTPAAHAFTNGVCTVCGDFEANAELEYELDFDSEFYYRVVGIKTSASYVVIPNIYNGLPVKEIDDNAFEGDQVLTKVFISSNVKSIGEKAFYNCPVLENIFFEGATKPATLGADWSDSVQLCYKGEYTLEGNVATSNIEDNTANQAYDFYIAYLESLNDNYTLKFEHILTTAATGFNVINTGTVEMKVNGDYRYAKEQLKSSLNGNESTSDLTEEYYNDGYLYSAINILGGMMYPNPRMSYSELPISQFISDSLTIDVITPNRSDFTKAIMTEDNGLVTVEISTSNGYTPQEIGKFINFDKIALNMDVSGILSMPNASASLFYCFNTVSGYMSIEFEMSGSTTEGSMKYETSSFYREIGETAQPICPNKDKYVLHNHNVSDVACGEDAICKSCKLIVKEATGHVFDTSNCESNKCTVCNEVVKTGRTHIYSDGKCEYCGLKQSSINLEFELSSDETYYILESIGKCGSKDIVIPEVYEGLPVKKIGSDAFDGAKIKSLYIPTSITMFDRNILGNCTTLEKLTIENIDNINSLSSVLGSDKVSNIKEVIILGGKEIDSNTFEEYYKNLETVVLPDSIETIGSSAFLNCLKLSEINFPESLKTIGSSAFFGCESLEKVVIPTSVTAINYGAFSNTNIKELTVNASLFETSVFNNVAEIIEKLTLTGSGALANYAFENATKLTTLVISEDVTGIGEESFAGCTSLKSVTIPSKVTKISDKAFYNCTALEEVSLTSGLLEIGKNAFAGCTSLKSVTIPATVTKINIEAFAGCTALEEVVYEEEAEISYIGMSAFKDCTALKSAPLVEGITSLGSKVFENCKFTEVVIPSTLESVGETAAFIGCVDVTKVTCNTPNVTVRSLFPDSKALEEVTLGGNSVRGESLFDMTSVKKVIITDEVESIGYSAFQNCTNLEEVVIGNSLATIDYRAFFNCTSLKKINLPSTLEGLSRFTFTGCTMDEMYYDGTIDDWCNVKIVSDSDASVSPIKYTTKFFIKNEENEYYDLKAVKEIVISTTDADISIGQLSGLDSIEKMTIPTTKFLGYYFGCANKSYNGDYIPESLKEVVIQGGDTITAEAFRNCTSLEKVTIGDSVKYINQNAFMGCENLKTLVVPFTGSSIDGDRYTSIGYLFGATDVSSNNNYVPESLKEVTVTNTKYLYNNAFRNCQSLEKVILSEGTESVGRYSFANCTSLKEVVLPSTLKVVAEYAFNQCNSLEEIKLPQGVEEIQTYAFKDCTALENVYLPSSITTIGNYAFSGCTAFTNLYFEGTIEDWSKIEFGQYDGNPMIYADNLYMFNGEEYELITKLEIPDTVTEIGMRQFANLTCVKEIIIPNTVTSIGSAAFDGCTALEKITLPLLSNFTYYFSTLPTSLKEVVVNGGRSVNERSFKGCSSIEKITLPEGIITISNYAFDGCASLVDINIPSTVTSIGNNIFANCESLENIYYGGTIENWVALSFNYNYTQNPMYFANHFYMLDGEEYEEVTHIVIPEGVEYLGANQFYGFENITSVTIPASLTSIGNYAFTGCTALENIYYNGTLEDWCNISFSTSAGNPMLIAKNIYFLEGDEYKEITDLVVPESIVNIKQRQFINFTSVKTITIPDTVTEIGLGAFEGCTAVESITLPFAGKSIDDSSYGYLSYIFGASSYTYDSGYIPEKLKEIIVTKDTSLGANAFRNCNSLTSVELPNDTLSIGANAFYNCFSLTEISIPETVTTIGKTAFYECNKLTEMVIPNSVTELGQYCFQGCTSLETITLPFVGNTIDVTNAYLTYHFGGYSYSDNKNYLPESLKEVIITKDTEIPENVFYNCIYLETITIPSNTKTIGAKAFYGCSVLKNHTIPTTVTSIGTSGYYGCALLTDITIPSGMTEIKESTFKGCTSLKTLTIPETITTINANILSNCTSLESLTVPFVGKTINDNNYNYLGYIFGGTSGADRTYTAVPSSLKEVIITKDQEISSSAFYMCSTIESIILSQETTSIGQKAFYGCNALKSFEIPANVTTIDYYTFYNCKNLATVTLAENTKLETIGESAFASCSALSSFTLPTTVKTIGYNAFNSCSSISTIIIPESVTTINGYAFQHSGLTNIYCVASIQPEGWLSNWNKNCNATVTFGYVA